MCGKQATKPAGGPLADPAESQPWLRRGFLPSVPVALNFELLERAPPSLPPVESPAAGPSASALPAPDPSSAGSPMAPDMRLDTDGVFSFDDEDFLAALFCAAEAEANARPAAAPRMLRSACRSESDHVGKRLRDYQERMCSCKEKIYKAKAETIADNELNLLQNEMEENLQKEKQLRTELRALLDELDNLDHQRASIKQRKDAIKKRKKEVQKAENALSMCVSVTNIIPNLEDQDKISSYTVNKNAKKIRKSF